MHGNVTLLFLSKVLLGETANDLSPRRESREEQRLCKLANKQKKAIYVYHLFKMTTALRFRNKLPQSKPYNVLQRSEWLSMEAAILLTALASLVEC